MDADRWIERIAQGDTQALDKLVEAFYPEILRYCLWHAPNPSLAEDAAQETFLKAIRYFDRYVHKGKFKAFLYQIAANTCIDMGRKKCLTEASLEDLPAELPDSGSALGKLQSDIFFQELVRQLPETDQELVILRYGQDLTLREVSQVTHLPLRTVQSRLRSALKRLKIQLEGGYFHDQP